jgi:hypothetical protein
LDYPRCSLAGPQGVQRMANREGFVRNHRAWWLVLRIAMGICAVLLAYWFFVRHELGALRPPGEKCQFAAFLDHKAGVREYRILRAGQAEYLEVVGTLSNSWTLPSGPPCYVFDRSGTLVAWTSDIGDDPQYDAEWRGRYSAEKVSLAEALKWIGSSGDTQQWH